MGRRLCLAAVVCAVAAAAPAAGGTAAAPRPKAPPIAGLTVTGGTASLEALRGKPVFVNVWSSW